MIQELSDLGKRLREESSKEKLVHDALKDEPISIDLIIDDDGSFIRFDVIDKISRPAEAITAKKGKARLLLDKAEEVLGYNNDVKKYELYIAKLEEYRTLPVLQPVFEFYGKNKTKGIKKALSSFDNEVPEKERKGNIAFRIQGKERLHERKQVYDAIISKYEKYQANTIEQGSNTCSICGKKTYPLALLHEKIKGVPPFDDGQSAMRNLISFKYDAYQSYNLDRGQNSYICSNCAKLYAEGLNWLLTPRGSIIDKKGKEIPIYPHRKSFGDTAMVYWTKQNQQVDELDLLDEPDEGQVSDLIESVKSGDKRKMKLNADQFYSCTLSGAAARIAVRDWIELSLFDIQASIAEWFKDIEIGTYDSIKKEIIPHYSRIYDLARTAQNEKEKNDVTLSRVAVSLWKATLEGKPIPIKHGKNEEPTFKKKPMPIWVLSSVLRRIKVDERGITPERAALIKLILNRNNNGGEMMNSSVDDKNDNVAYLCGRMFCVIENIQRAALGKTNAGVRERFFSSASTTPSSAFGRLIRMSQNHLTKIKGEKPGLAVIFDKELQELSTKMADFPATFRLEDQGRFALGYYHQKHETFRKAAENKDMRDALNDEETNSKGE